MRNLINRSYRMKPIAYLLLEIFLISICTVFCEDEKLVSVVQIFRHGERTPLMFSTNDPYKDLKYWDGVKHGHLTKVGKQQHRELGSFFRRRYNDFLSKEYDPSELIVRCSNSERTYGSARSFLEGLYPYTHEAVLLHKAGRSVLRALMNCPKYILSHMKLMREDEYFRDFDRRNQYLYDYLRQGVPTILSGIVQGYGLWDCLHLESRRNLTLEEWTKSVYPFPLEYVARNFTLAMCRNEELQRLGIGTLLDAIIEHFDGRLRNSKEKVLLYSGHDLNLSCLLNAFRAYETIEPNPPPFASSFIFELRRGEKGAFLNGYYKDGKELHPVKFRDCDFDCDYGQFKRIFNDIRLSEWEWVHECLNIF